MTCRIAVTTEIILLTALLAGPALGITFFPECWQLVRSCVMGKGESSGMEKYPCVTRSKPAMAHWYALLILLVAVTTRTWSDEVKKNYFETCWAKITDCMSGGNFQATSYMNQCRLRCQCLGRRSGYCRLTRCSNRKPGYGFLCECQGTLIRYHSLLLDLCEE